MYDKTDEKTLVLKQAIENRTRLRRLVQEQHPLIYEWIAAEFYAVEAQQELEAAQRSEALRYSIPR